ncbi:MAG TPA: 2-hydroxyacyl-CoA dehydratase [Deltaproteobacteria bacterium]|nr:2-hydroxyacyl-CoA dehydratase [Deltaproteobacteria bacterium]
MLKGFQDIATSLSNRFVDQWKREGKQVVGFTCSYVPEEIISAAGLLPFRMRGIGATSTSIADTYFGPVICSFPKCILQLAGEGAYDFLDGVILTPGCDSIRRLDECWRKAVEDSRGTFPGFHVYYGVPHKVTQYSLEWFVEETKILLESIEEYFGITVASEDLRDAIRVFNRSRTLLKRLEELRSREHVPITGADATAVIISANAMPRDLYNRILEDLIDELDQSKDGIHGRKRLLLSGSANDDIDLVRLIESSGGMVVADTLCFGSRSYSDLAEEDGDPLLSIAKRYLSHTMCPRMFGYYKQRLAFMKERIQQANVQGVILQNIRFCDMHGSENSLFERDLEAMGIPCLRIEREYGPLVEEGRIKMRIDAFMEGLNAG